MRKILSALTSGAMFLLTSVAGAAVGGPAPTPGDGLAPAEDHDRAPVDKGKKAPPKKAPPKKGTSKLMSPTP